MDSPQPIDINRLKKMLGGAKAIMNKVETGNYSSGNIDESTLALGDQLVESNNGNSGGNPARTAAPKMNNGEPYYANMSKSKLPESIKKAMMEQPIPQINGMPEAFTLDEVMDYEKDEKPIPSKTRPRQKQINETVKPVNVDEKMVRQIIKEEMRTIVKDEMIEFFTKYFAKSLAEDTQKKLIQHLLKEGKLSVKKK